MKVGTDAVLLGAWVAGDNAGTALDVGTGTGVIAIMLAQKGFSLIDAIEINKEAFEQAGENVYDTPWAGKLNVLNISLQQYACECHKQYDLIISNPPYFIDASKPSEYARTIARHTDDSLTHGDLLKGVKKLLAPHGRFCVILPYNEGKLLIESASREGLHCNKLLHVKTKTDKPEKRTLMEFSYISTPIQEDHLIIQEDDTHYTQDYIAFTSEYYLGLKKR